MRGFRIDRHGGPEVLGLRELPEPVLRPGEVRVRVRACGLNHLDLWVRNGVDGYSFPLPLVPGSEIAGNVETLGALGELEAESEQLELGAPVVVGAGVSCGHCVRCLSGQDWLCGRYGLLGEHRDGGCAELVAVPRRNLFPIPRGLTYVEAAAIPLVFLTAWHMLAVRAELGAHEDVLLHAAGSGVTTAGIQIARLLGARRIIVTSSSPAKLARALELGATDAIDVGAGDFAKAVRQATGGRGVDVVFDHVGGATFERSFKCLAWGGRIVTCGATSGATAQLPLRAVFFKSLSILGSTMGSNAELARLLPWFERAAPNRAEAAALRPVVAESWPLEELADAQERLAARAVFGKIVIRVTTDAHEVARPV